MAGPWEKYQKKPWEKYQGNAENASIGQRILKGLRDPVDASAQLLTNILPDSVVNAGNKVNNWLADKTGLVGALPEGGVDQQVRDSEAQYQQDRQAAGQSGVDWARLGGNIVSPMNLAIASKVPAAASLSGRIASGASAGALFGLTGSPVTEGDFAKEKAKQVGIGALAGGVLPAVTGGVARMVQPKTSPDVQALMKQGVTPTPGQILGGAFQGAEDKATSIPLVGDAILSARNKGVLEFNKAAYARTLEPIGGKVPSEVGREGVKEVSKQISQAYDDLLPKVTFNADQVFASDVAKLTQMAKALPKDQARRFEAVLRDQVIGKLGPRGTMDGQTLKGVESELGRLARGLRGDASFDNRQLGDAIMDLQTSIRANLARTNPAYANELTAVNRAFANYARIRDAASRQGSKDGVFTPAQLSAAVRAQDKSAGKGVFAKGGALMQDLSDPAKSVLPSQVPDSGTAGRALLGAGALGGVGMLSPATASMGALSTLPYLPGGRQLAAGILTRRPQGAAQMADAIRQATPYLTPGALPLLTQPGQ